MEVTWRARAEGNGSNITDPTVYTGLLGTGLTCLRSYEATGSHQDLLLCAEITDTCASLARTSLRSFYSSVRFTVFSLSFFVLLDGSEKWFFTSFIISFILNSPIVYFVGYNFLIFIRKCFLTKIYFSTVPVFIKSGSGTWVFWVVEEESMPLGPCVQITVGTMKSETYIWVSSKR